MLLVGGRGAPLQRETQGKWLGWTCPHDPSAIMAAIQEAIKNPEKRQAMGRNARQVFDMRHSKTIAMQRWEPVLNSVLTGERIAGEVLVNTGDVVVFFKKKTASAGSV